MAIELSVQGTVQLAYKSLLSCRYLQRRAVKRFQHMNRYNCHKVKSVWKSEILSISRVKFNITEQ